MITILSLIFIIISAVFHEVAHGVAALYLGDPTAKQMGRLTLNPLKHLDPWGSVLMPIMLAIATAGQFIFAAAKPVPINPAYFKSVRRDFMITALAGPFTNFLLAAAALFGIRAALLGGLSATSGLVAVLALFALVNIILLSINLIPIPPLDGSRVLYFLFPALNLERFERSGIVLVLIVLLLVPAIPRWFIGFFGTALFKLFGLCSVGQTLGIACL